MTTPKKFGDEIMIWRQGQGRSRKWLAEKVGVSQKTVESWEYGTRNPSGPAVLLLETLINQEDQSDSRTPNDD